MPTHRFRSLTSPALAALFSVAAGCSSPPPREVEHSPMPSVAPVDLPPVMAGTENFAGGKITVRVTLAMPGNFRSAKEADSGDAKGGSGRHGGGGGRHHGGSMGGGETPASDDSSDETPRPRVSGSNLPPAQLKLSLQNNSATDAVKCEVTDFNSYLGDFAVFPSRYQVEAGQSVSSEIMTSRLGVEGGDIPVTVALRIGDHTESKVVTLHLLNPPADAAK